MEMAAKGTTGSGLSDVEKAWATISLVEKRFEKSASSGEKVSTDSSEFRPQIKCLYLQLLGDAYYKCYKLHSDRSNDLQSKPDQTVAKNCEEKCLGALERGLVLSAEYLEYYDPLRLLLVHSYCTALRQIRNQPLRAKLIAERTFEGAAQHTNDIAASISMLQHLRDRFMTYVQSEEEAKVSNEPSQDVIKEEIAVYFPVTTRPRSIRVKEIDSIKTQRLVTTTVTVANFTNTPITPNSRFGEAARRIRRIIASNTSQRPVILESLTSAPRILTALDRIFRVYVRGNALPGLLSGEQTVDLAGQKLSFRRFILSGPYMSWLGFLSFLLDFSVALPPSPNTKVGQAFIRSVGGSLGQYINDHYGGDGNTTSGMVDMHDAAIVFVESCQSAQPMLCLRKHILTYQEIAADYDTWTPVFQWAETGEWDINVGLNFMQFVDCCGKLGILSCSDPQFAEILPTPEKKISHFLTAYLGLADERKWSAKTNTRLQKTRAAIRAAGR